MAMTTVKEIDCTDMVPIIWEKREVAKIVSGKKIVKMTIDDMGVHGVVYAVKLFNGGALSHTYSDTAPNVDAAKSLAKSAARAILKRPTSK